MERAKQAEKDQGKKLAIQKQLDVSFIIESITLVSMVVADGEQLEEAARRKVKEAKQAEIDKGNITLGYLVILVWPCRDHFPAFYR